MNMITAFKKWHTDVFYLFKTMNMIRYCSSKKGYTDQKTLTKAQRKAVRSYYAKYSRVWLLFHNFYTQKTGEFSVKYIPDTLYYNKINRFYNDHQKARVIDHKGYYDIIFPHVEQPEMLACKKGGYWFLGQDPVSLDQVLDVLCSQDALFIKRASDSCGGIGVRCISKAETKDFKQDIIDTLNAMPADIIVQKPIQQHEALSRLNPTSTNTIRIFTMLRNGKVKIYSSVLRIGNKGAKIDNFSSGGMSVGITDDGKLKEYAYFISGKRIAQHPATGIVFKDYQLPSFEAAKELVLKAHWYVPHFKMVSWDISIRQDGTPILIETNLSDGQLDLHQMNNGPIFGDDTEEILNEVFRK